MDNQFLGQISFFAFGQIPSGWVACNGQLLPVNSNQALFSLLGTLYGGNGSTTFGLPDLRGVVPLGFSGAYAQGSRGGEEKHKLTTGEIPPHVHSLNGDGQTPASSNIALPGLTTLLGNTADVSSSPVSIYGSGSPSGAMAPQAVGNAGHDTPHENRMPYTVLSACIALTGTYPSRN